MSYEPFMKAEAGASATNDVVYIPLFCRSMQNDPNWPRQYAYTIDAQRLPMRYEDLVTCIGELQSLGDEVQVQTKQPLCLKIGVWGTLVLFFFVWSSGAVAMACEGSPISVITWRLLPVLVVSFILMICRSLRDTCERMKVTVSEDMLYNDQAPCKRRIEEKLKELGARFGVMLDLLSTSHVVDKHWGNRVYLTDEQAWQSKRDFGQAHGIKYFNANRSMIADPTFFAWCVAVRANKSSAWRSAPPLPPIWCQDASIVEAVLEQKWCSFTHNSTDPEVAQAIKKLNWCLRRHALAKGIVLAISIPILFIGGLTIITGFMAVQLGLGAGAATCPAGSMAKEMDGFAEKMGLGLSSLGDYGAHVIYYYGFVLLWLSSVVFLVKLMNMLDPMKSLTQVASTWNRSSSGVFDINIGVEISMRRGTRGKSGSASSKQLQILPESVVYLQRRS